MCSNKLRSIFQTLQIMSFATIPAVKYQILCFYLSPNPIFDFVLIIQRFFRVLFLRTFNCICFSLLSRSHFFNIHLHGKGTNYTVPGLHIKVVRTKTFSFQNRNNERKNSRRNTKKKKSQRGNSVFPRNN
jgi:hypothetical protein